jgi:PAS domain S-box-containing protein
MLQWTGRRGPASGGRLTLVAVVLAAHAAVYGAGAADALYLAVMAAASGVASWGALRQARRSAAVPVALGVTLTTAGDVVWFVYSWTGSVPDISVADVAYLGGYLALALGLWRMANTRGRSRAQQVDGWLDGAGVFVAMLVLVWQLSVAGTVSDGSLPVLTRVVWALYPALDAAFIGLVFRLVATRSRGERAPLAVAAGAACWLGSDLGFLLVADPEVSSVWFDTGWLLGALLLAAAAGHGGRPERAAVEPVDAVPSLARLAVSLGALLVPAGLELLRGVTGAGGAPVTVFGGTLVLTLLVFVRVARVLRAEAAARALVRSQQRYSAALARHSSDAVAVLSVDGHLVSDPASLGSVLGVGAAGELASGDLVRLSGVDPAQARRVFHEALSAGGGVVDAELPCRRDDGVQRWFGVRLADLRTDPDVGGVVVHFTDITDRKRAE